MKGAMLFSSASNMGFFFPVVKLFGNNFDLIKSLSIRSRSKAEDRPYHSSSSFNSYVSFIMNGFNKNTTSLY